ncbi:MAG: phosphodiester glycosidase family protein, partial [Deltaproteobacteria bacterium]|nr:phosphodiester glycosidase family protein [Deltaproteobacteria bacterium]
EAALRREAIEFAIQVGPRVVALGRPLPLKPQRAERSAIGILPDGALVVVASQGGVVESNDLAQVMAAPPTEDGLGCRDALMMDGGPSAQLYAAAGDFQLDLPGLYGVPIAVGFVKR